MPKKAVEELNNSTKFGKNIIRATFFKSKQERQKERVAIRNKILKDYPKSNLCIVTHITPITEQIIREKLGSCGEIYSIFIKAVEKKSTDIAYVCFTSEQSAQNAITESEKLGWEATIYRSKTQNYPGYPYLFSQFYPYMQSDFLFDRQKSNNVQTPLSVNMPFVHLPFSFPTYPQQHNKTTKKSKKGKSKKSANSFVEQKVEQKVVTKEMSEDLGNNLYDYISEKLHFDEDTSARITGVLLESLNYYDLKERLETDQESLKKTIVLVGEELKKQE
ncbi:Polyadenylate-binding protein [Entamoeba marina]